MNKEELISKVKEYVIKNSEKNDIHGFEHIERVYRLCNIIGDKLNADLLVLKIAALLHDIGRIHEKKDGRKNNHAEISANIAEQYLSSITNELNKTQIGNIVHCIKSHSFSNNISPTSLEAKILSDADKLDALGAIGLYRTIGFTIQNSGGIKEVIEHLESKILKLKDLLYLEESKKIAEERQKILHDFYQKIKQQI